jgi:hypothetical protein
VVSERAVEIYGSLREPYLVRAEFRLTIEQIKKEITDETVIYYSSRTPWWTHREEDLCKTKPLKNVTFTTPGGHSWTTDIRELPCDPRGAPLYRTRPGDALSFIEEAEASPDHYGKHGIKAFMAAHAKNCGIIPGQSWALENWEQYNDLIDVSETVKG